MKGKKSKVFKSAISILMVMLMASTTVLCAMAESTSGSSSSTSGIVMDSSGEKALWADGCAQQVTEIDQIKWFERKTEGIHYLFMPANSDLSNVKLTHNFDQFSIDGTAVASGDTYAFEDDKEYTVTCDDGEKKLVVMQSSSVGTMFLTTESGYLEKEDKEKRDKGLIVIVDAQGNVNYDGVLEQIKGRGNTTWTNIDKKPYNIKLEKATEILGMNKSKKYSLLAAGQDHTSLRNKIMYDLANDIGLTYSPNSKFVDMYANGEYQGTYQVTEKVEIGKNNVVKIYDLESATEKANGDVDLDTFARKQNGRGNGSYKYVDIPNDPADITGGYLLEFDVQSKYEEEVSGFITSRGQHVVVKDPEYASKAQVEYIRNYVQKAEDAYYASTGYNTDGKHYSEYYDMEDMARMYLLQEFSVNIDSGITSCFFYKDSETAADSKIHAGPAWDFDVALGNLTNRKDGVTMTSTNQWFAKIATLYTNSKNNKTIFAQLCTKDDFWGTVELVYNRDFVPAVNVLTSKTSASLDWVTSLGDYADLIADSIDMNYIVWKHTLVENQLVPQKAGYTHESNLAYLEKFITARFDWLNEQLYADITVLLGDVNLDGDISINDATLLQKYLAAMEPLNATQFANADANKDGSVDIKDVTKIQRMLAGYVD